MNLVAVIGRQQASNVSATRQGTVNGVIETGGLGVEIGEGGVGRAGGRGVW